MGPFCSIRTPLGGSLLRYRNQGIHLVSLEERLDTSSAAGELVFHVIRIRTRRVGRWRNGEMVLRWAASAFLETEKNFRKIQGYRDLWMLEAKLKDEVAGEKQSKVA